MKKCLNGLGLILNVSMKHMELTEIYKLILEGMWS